MPLSDTAIRKSKSKDKTYMISDNGLYPEVRSNGSKSWKLRLWEDGKERKVTLGSYPQVTLRDARNHKDNIKTGKTLPIKLSKKRSFKEFAAEWLDVLVKPVRSPRHIETIESRLALYLLPLLGHRVMDEISAPELLYVIRQIEKKGYLETAHRCLGIFGQIARFAIASGVKMHDLSADLKGALRPIREKGHHATLTEPDDIAMFIRDLEKIPSPYVRRAAIFQAYTIVRPGELRHAEWNEIDFEEKLWRIPPEKMKMKRPHLVPLSRQALETLDFISKDRLSDKWIFPMIHRRNEPMSEATVLAAIKRLGYTGKMTGHGFRAMASTRMNEHGWLPDAIERQLAHIEKNAVRAAYNHAQYLDIRREMLQWWADYLDGLRG